MALEADPLYHFFSDLFLLIFRAGDHEAESIYGKTRIVVTGKLPFRQTGADKQPDKRKENSQQNSKFESDDNERNPGHDGLAAHDEFPRKHGVKGQSQPGSDTEKASKKGVQSVDMFDDI